MFEHLPMCELWTVIRRGRVTAAILGGLTPVIDDGELLAGKFSRRALTPEEAAELAAFKSAVEPAMAPVLGQRAHMAIDIEKLLRLGIRELQRTIEGYRARLDLARPAELEQDAFYRACLIALEAVCDYAQRYAELAATLAAAEPDPARRAELENLAAVCRRVPAFPARTFHEAVQAVHFVNFCLCAGRRMLMFQFGRPDRYLLPFYRRDPSAGRLTPA